MSDSGLTGQESGARFGGSLNTQYSVKNLADRFKMVTDQNPYMAATPEAVMAMVYSPMSTPDLASHAGALYGVQVGTAYKGQLEAMEWPQQRAVYHSLPLTQQQALQQMGYKVPNDHDPGFWDSIGAPIGFAADLVGAPLHAIGHVVQPALSKGLHLMNEVANFPGYVYRSLRTLDDTGQAFALLGGIAGGAAALALAAPTGFGSLVIAGSIIGGALGGGTAASGVGSILTGTTDEWLTAFGTSWNGERVFDRPSQEHAREILGDPRLVAMAKDFAREGFTAEDLAKEMAGTSGSEKDLLATINKLALKSGAEGTPGYQAAYGAMVTFVQDATFQKAVSTLQKGKISFGRDVVDTFTPFDPGSLPYNLMSGSLDAAFMIASDPFLMGTHYYQSWRVASRAVVLSENGARDAEMIREMVNGNEHVARNWDRVAKAVDQQDFNYIRGMGTGFEEQFITLLEAHRNIAASQALGTPLPRFTREHLLDWAVSENQMRPLLAGIGIKRGTHGYVLSQLKEGNAAWQTWAQRARALTDGMTDAGLERKMVKIATETRHPELIKIMNEAGLREAEAAGREFVPWEHVVGTSTAHTGHEAAYALGFNVASNPIGRFFLPSVAGRTATSLTTMTMRGNAVALTGVDAPREIRAFVESLRHLNMSSYARRRWVDNILAAPNPNARAQLLMGALDDAAITAGIDVLPEGRALMNEYITRNTHIYALGGEDYHRSMDMGGEMIRTDGFRGIKFNDLAVEMHMPNLTALRRSVKGGLYAKMIGITDLPALEQFMTRYWKPSVLMRIGFIPRAAGEEFINFMLRGGIGGLGQETAARSIGRKKAYDRAMLMQNSGYAHLMSPSQKALIHEGPLVGHVRAVANMMARYNHTDPIYRKLEDYSNTVRKFWEHGHSSGGIERAIASVGETSAGGTFSRANVAENLQSLVFGNPLSWRRMMKGGVDDHLVNAAEAFYRLHSTTVMREVSAINANILTSGSQDRRMFAMSSVDPKTGEIVEMPMEIVRGQFQRYDVSDRVGLNMFAHQLAGIGEDPLHMQNLHHLVRWRHPNVAPAELGSWMDDYRRVESDLAHTLLDEFLPEALVDRRGFNGALNGLARRETRVIAEMRDLLPASGDITIDHVIGALDEIVAESRRAGKVDVFTKAAVDQLREAKRLVSRFEQLAVDERQYAATFLRWGRNEGVNGNHIREGVMPSIASEASAPPEPLFWNNKAEAHAGMNRRYAINLSDPNNAVLTMAGDRMGNGAERLSEGLVRVYIPPQFVRRADGTEITLADILNAADNKPLIETNAATINAMLERNMAHDVDYAESVMLGNIDLARELDLVHHRLYGTDPAIGGQRTRYADYQHTILDGRIHFEKAPVSASGTDLPATKPRPVVRALNTVDVPGQRAPLRTDQTQAWVAPTNALTPRMRPIDRIQSAQDDLDSWAHTMVEQVFNTMGRGTRERMTFVPERVQVDQVGIGAQELEQLSGELTTMTSERADLAAKIAAYKGKKGVVGLRKDLKELDARIAATTAKQTERTAYHATAPTSTVESIPKLYTKEGGKYVPVELGTEASRDVPYYKRSTKRDKEYERVTWHDREFFEGMSVENPGEQIAWGHSAPVLQDILDKHMGRTRYIDAESPVRIKGVLQPSGDIVHVPRLRTDHVDIQQAPNHTFGPTLRAPTGNRWDRLVEFGFDRVIGPSIDALARRPMAFHFFQEQYRKGMKARSWLVDENITRRIEDLLGNKIFKDPAVADDARQIAEHLKYMAAFQGDAAAINWTHAQALAYGRSFTPDEMAALIRSTKRRSATVIKRAADPAEVRLAKIAQVRANQLSKRNLDEVLTAAAPTFTEGDFLTYVRNQVGEDLLRDQKGLMHAVKEGNYKDHKVLSQLDDAEWQLLHTAEMNWKHATDEVGELAAVAAIREMMPFIDSHELKTQFAEYGRGLMPFWYAEENFMKRWARTLLDEGPAAIRKAQLGYMGLKEVGVIRSDEQGKDWFVYPGSTLLMEAVDKLFWVGSLGQLDKDLLPVGAMFQTPTDSMFPGLTADKNRLGAPTFGPLLSLPMSLLSSFVPELKPMNIAMFGEQSASLNQNVLGQLVPQSLRNFYDAAFAGDGNARYASAQLAAIAQLEATGHGLSDTASPGERDEFLRKVRDHARIIMVSRALTGFVTPGAPSAVVAGDSASITGLDMTNNKEIFSNTYQTLIKALGIEQGTIKFLEIHPESNLEDIVNPMAFTVGQSTSASGAPLPATQIAMSFYDNNSQYFQTYPDASPWLLPSDPNAKGERSAYAYDQQTISGLRRRRTPEQFLTAIKFKEASGTYFGMKKANADAIDLARLAGDTDEVRRLQAAWTVTAATYKALHPVFAQELEGGDGQERRKTVMAQMRIIINDPGAPNSPQLPELRRVMNQFDQYRAALLDAGVDTSMRGDARKELIKQTWSDWMEKMVIQYPSLQSFWQSVLRPESSLD